MMREQRIVELHSDRTEVAVLAHVVVGRVRIEDERRLIIDTWSVVEPAVSEERARKQLRRRPLFGSRASAEPVAPAEVDESVHVLLMVVNDPGAGIERNGKAGPRPV